MTETIQSILQRRSIRRYKPEQISDDELEMILTAGTYAPNAGSRQSPVMVVLQDDSLIQTLGRINKGVMRLYMPVVKVGNVSITQPSIADDDSIESAFYGAPTVVAVFAPKAHRYAVEDGTMVIGTMMLAAHSLGIGSCMIARAAETFATDEDVPSSESGASQGIIRRLASACWAIARADCPRPNHGRNT